MAPTLAYWDIRGLAEPIRCLLSYKNVDYVDKRYTSREDWMNEKFNLGLDFPNLPYWIDGKHVRFTQSLAILRYLARKYGLDGKDECQKLRAEMVEQQLMDLRLSLIRTAYSSTYEKSKEELLAQIPAQMKQWSDYLGKKTFLLGDNLTYVDFVAYDVFDFYEMFSPTVYDAVPNIKEYLRRFERLPELQSHFKSPTYRRWPVFGPFATFGGSGEEPPKIP